MMAVKWAALKAVLTVDLTAASRVAQSAAKTVDLRAAWTDAEWVGHWGATKAGLKDGHSAACSAATRGELTAG